MIVRHQITRAEYHAMAERGEFDGRRVELIGGEIVEMSPQGSLHSAMVDIVAGTLTDRFGDKYYVRRHAPLAVLPDSEPEPDVSVVLGSVRDYLKATPATAVLAVEVSDSSLRRDRGRKGSLYASVGIKDYWIINLNDMTVEVYRIPVPDRDQPFGVKYSQRVDYRKGQNIVPVARKAKVAVRDLLP